MIGPSKSSSKVEKKSCLSLGLLSSKLSNVKFRENISPPRQCIYSLMMWRNTKHFCPQEIGPYYRYVYQTLKARSTSIRAAAVVTVAFFGHKSWGLILSIVWHQDHDSYCFDRSHNNAYIRIVVSTKKVIWLAHCFYEW